MRELTVREMDQASGGVVPIIGVVLALGSLVVKHKVAATAIGVAGLLVAGVSLVQSENGCTAESVQ